MEFYKGKNSILYIKVLGEYIPISCLSNNSIVESADFINKSVGGGWTSIIPTRQRYAIEFEGYQVDESDLSYEELRSFKRNRTRIEWKISTADNLFIEEGFGYISNLTQNAEIGEMVTFSGVITGYGIPISSTLKRGDFNNDFNNDFY